MQFESGIILGSAFEVIFGRNCFLRDGNLWRKNYCELEIEKLKMLPLRSEKNKFAGLESFKKHLRKVHDVRDLAIE